METSEVMQRKTSSRNKVGDNLLKQCESDIEVLKNTIRNDAPNKSHEVLLKIYYMIYRGGLYYRDQSGKGEWRDWSKFGMPLASVLCHASRVLVQLPINNKENAALLKNFRAWFTGTDLAESALFQSFESGFASRVASHGIQTMSHSESLSFWKTKKIQEIKVDGINKIISNIGCHKGINLAWGGYKQLHPTKYNQLITENGENGHLYFYCWAGDSRNPGAFLIGLEPSSPPVITNGYRSVPSQYGDSHSIFATTSTTGMNGHDKYANGVFQNIGPQYYDSLFVILDTKLIQNIMSDFNPNTSQLDFLYYGFNKRFLIPTKDDIFEFIKEEKTEISSRIFPEILKKCTDNLKNATKNKEWSFSSVQGWNLLHYAAYYNRDDLIDDLAKYGININARDNYGCTPLMISIYYNEGKYSKKTIEALLKNKADPDVTSNIWYSCLGTFCRYFDWRGWAPLHIAAYKGDHEAIVTLLNNGADKLKTVFYAGKPYTPEEIAKTQSHDACMRILKVDNGIYMTRNKNIQNTN